MFYILLQNEIKCFKRYASQNLIFAFKVYFIAHRPRNDYYVKVKTNLNFCKKEEEKFIPPPRGPWQNLKTGSFRPGKRKTIDT